MPTPEVLEPLDTIVMRAAGEDNHFQLALYKLEIYAGPYGLVQLAAMIHFGAALEETMKGDLHAP